MCTVSHESRWAISIDGVSLISWPNTGSTFRRARWPRYQAEGEFWLRAGSVLLRDTPQRETSSPAISFANGWRRWGDRSTWPPSHLSKAMWTGARPTQWTTPTLCSSADRSREEEGLELDFLERFRSSRTIGVNLSMLVPLDAWSPFDRLFERDSSERTRPDLVFLARPPLVPVIGVCLVEAYEGGNTEWANAAIERLLADREVSRISIDTRLDVNTTDLRTPREIESTIARMDALVTTRLHGMVLALKNGVPVVAIDPEPGGGKIQKQGRALNWPYVFVVDNVSDSDLRRALDRCLERGAGAEARLCAERARSKLAALRNEFVAALSSPRDSEEGSDR